jgi:hypothetical protein
MVNAQPILKYAKRAQVVLKSLVLLAQRVVRVPEPGECLGGLGVVPSKRVAHHGQCVVPVLERAGNVRHEKGGVGEVIQCLDGLRVRDAK